MSQAETNPTSSSGRTVTVVPSPPTTFFFYEDFVKELEKTYVMLRTIFGEPQHQSEADFFNGKSILGLWCLTTERMKRSEQWASALSKSNVTDLERILLGRRLWFDMASECCEWALAHDPPLIPLTYRIRDIKKKRIDLIRDHYRLEATKRGEFLSETNGDLALTEKRLVAFFTDQMTQPIPSTSSTSDSQGSNVQTVFDNYHLSMYS